MAMLLGSGQSKGRTGGFWSGRLWALLCVGLLTLTVLAPVVAAEESADGVEQQQFTLTITDNGEGLLFWVESITLYAYDPATETRVLAEARSGDPAVSIDLLSDPAECLLPGGHYEITISIPVRGEVQEIILGVLELKEDKLFDIIVDGKLYEVVEPWDVGPVIC